MAALEIVKNQIPDLHVTMFGVPEKPVDLPDWYSYYRTPDQKTHNAVYNNAGKIIPKIANEEILKTITDCYREAKLNK